MSTNGIRSLIFEVSTKDAKLAIILEVLIVFNEEKNSSFPPGKGREKAR